MTEIEKREHTDPSACVEEVKNYEVTVMPAPPGFYMLAVMGNKPDEWTIDKVWKIPIIAWEFIGASMRPRTCNPTLDCAVVYTVMNPDGSVHAYNYHTRETTMAHNLEEYLEGQRQRAKDITLLMTPSAGSA